MKVKILLIILYSINCYCQTIEVKYYNNQFVNNPEQYKTLPKNIQVAYTPKLFSYKLVTDGTVSLYQNEDIKLELKEEISTTTTLNENGDTLKSVIKSDGLDLRTKESLCFKNFKTQKMLWEQFYDEYYRVEDNIPKYNWKITDETETILGYACKKATFTSYGEYVEAWYTEKIPVADGPDKIYGLPGLILKVRFRTSEIIAYKINSKNEPIKISPPVFKGKVYTFDSLSEEFKKRTAAQSQSKFNPGTGPGEKKIIFKSKQ